MKIVEVQFVKDVTWRDEAGLLTIRNRYLGEHARWAKGGYRGDGIEIQESDNDYTFVPVGNIAFVREERMDT